MELVIGNGKLFFSAVHRDGRHGLLIRPVDEAHEINSKDPDWVPGVPYTPVDRDIILWMDRLDAAQVFQEAVNIAVLHVAGYQVTEAATQA